ncbi:MAG: hypothetical protein AB7V18_08465 [Pyrinomonadaceae bacterium]
MERSGYIEIRVIGKRGNLNITPDNYDIREITAVLEQAENLLFPGGKKDRPIITYEIREGSVKHVLRTTLQAVIGFNAILLSVQENNYSIDFLETQTARAFEYFQDAAKKQGVTFEICTSIQKTGIITVDQDTNFARSEEVWVDAEFYFYGIVTDFGGKEKANIHLDTKEAGILKIAADKAELRQYASNPLYKEYGIRAIGKQNVRNGEIDRSSLKLLEIIDYDRKFEEDYLVGLIKKASESWKGINNADEWLSDFRY